MVKELHPGADPKGPPSKRSSLPMNTAETDARRASFDAAARPLIKWLCENCHPHTTIVVTPTNAELLEGVVSTGKVLDYVRD